MLSEKEILDKLRKMLYHTQKANECGLSNNDFKEDIEALEGILDLYNKEKETSHFLQSELDRANAKILEEKEKNKELENCLQMAKQIMTADISEDFDCMKLKEFKEYLLNEGIVTYFDDDELKESVGNYLGVLLKKNIEKDYISKDKIKAKIEEVKDGTFDAKIVLQSLLEKE